MEGSDTKSPRDSQTVPKSDQEQIKPEPQSEIESELKPEPRSEFNPSSPSNTPDLGDAGPAPTRSHGRRRLPKRGYFDVRDASKVEVVMFFFDNLFFVTNIGFFCYSFIGSGHGYITAYSCFLSTWSILRLFYKWYRVQGGFDTFTSLLADFTPGAIGLIIALWGNNWKVLNAVNAFSLFFDLINMSIEWFQSYIKIPIKGNVKKFLRAKQFRDRYEDIGIAGLLPCNEATNKIIESPIIHREYYTLEKVDHEKSPVNDVEAPTLSTETPASLVN